MDSDRPRPPNLSRQDYYHLVYNLCSHLPDPPVDTPEAVLARNDAAIAQVAAMMPTNPSEAAIAAQCVATRAQADDALRLIRLNEGNIGLVMRLNAQYVSMVRASLGALGHLMRAQAVRHKREQSDEAFNADEWTQYLNQQSMRQVLDAGPVPAVSAARRATPGLAAAEPPVPAPMPVPTGEQSERTTLPAPDSAQPAMPVSAAPPRPVSVFALPSAPIAAVPPAPTTHVPDPQPRRSRHIAIAVESDEPLRDLASEADRYAVIYPRRAREIRRCRGLPPNCDFGPPDDDLIQAVVRGNSPALRELDPADAAVG